MAADGHLELCRLIIENLQDKNPADEYGETPLHKAAEKGYLELCRLIMENVENKNPEDICDCGVTPLENAAINKQSSIIELFKIYDEE